MRSSRQTKTAKPRRPLWHPDARARLRAILPELAVSVIASACISVVMYFDDGRSASAFLVLGVIPQLFVQIVLYACTYLGNDERLIYTGWLFIMIGIPSLSALLIALALAFGISAEPLIFYLQLAMGMGATIFYLTRLRWTFILLLFEVLVLSELINEMGDALPALLPTRLIGACALAVLFVMRSSATRVTISMTLDDPMDVADENERRSSRLSLYATVAGLGFIVSILCLAVSLAGSAPLLLRQYATSAPITTTSHNTGQSEQTDGLPAGTGGVDSEPLGSTPSSEAQGNNAQGGSTTSTSTRTRETGILGPLVGILALAVLALVGPARLLMRRLARRSIEREPRSADRAARLYLGVIARLGAAGITRDKAETPSEFLSHHGKELGEVAEAAGFDPSDWITLTDAYEKARYADIDPSDAELEACWRIYDALPGYARQTQGLRRYLSSSFWQM